MKYIPLFIAIQLASACLFVIGLPVCAVLAYGGFAKANPVSGLYHWPRWAWIFDNDEDGVNPLWYRAVNPTWSEARVMFTWSALRNSVNNLRYVPGVSKPGRPLWYRTWVMGGKQFYAKAGWAAKTGWPMMSAGAGRGW